MTALGAYWGFRTSGSVSERCGSMLDAQRIYAPDPFTLWSDGRVALGRRLHRTLPEDAYDCGPAAGMNGTLQLVGDLRIDNREELLAQTSICKMAGAETSDAALLMHCWERWGEGTLDRLLGDFAFVIWDSSRNCMFLARDYSGQRPLHYHFGNGFFAAASMPKGLHALPEIPHAPDEDSVAEFLALIPETGPRTFFQDVARVEPGHVLIVSPHGNSSRKYWRPQQRSCATKSRDYPEALREQLDRAVKARLRGAGMLVGTHLSGGLDSSAVAATAARLIGPTGRVVGFTSVPHVGYSGGAPSNSIVNEEFLAAATAQKYANIEHVLIRSGERSPIADLDRDVFLFGRPILNICNQVWMGAINEAARARGLTIMLTGQMGNISLSYAGLELLPQLLGQLRLSQLFGIVVPLLKGGLGWRRIAAQIFGAYLPRAAWQTLCRARGKDFRPSEYTVLNPALFAAMGRRANRRGLDLSYRPLRDGFAARISAIQGIDPGAYNKGTLAGWGIDLRDPTSDRRLMEFCLQVPGIEYLACGMTRSLARRALNDRLPWEVLTEPGRGYQAADWHVGASRARDELAAEIAGISRCHAGAAILDVDTMRARINDWPESGWERAEAVQRYRLGLLRGVSAGHFLRRVSGSN